MTEKRCTRCGMTKPLTAFRQKSKSKYFSSWCKKCESYYYKNDAPNAFWSKLKSNLKRHYSDFEATPTDLKRTLGEPKECYICGGAIICRSEAELDHVVPLSRGGETSLHNLRWAHKRCNRVKHDMMLDEMLDLMKKIIAHHKAE
jgi:5-methylcytosine-specific restriction endonuclease McrA